MTSRVDTVLDAETIDRIAPGPDDIAHFQELGWWVSPPVLDDETIAAALRGAERIYAGEFDTPLPNGQTTVGWQPSDGDVLRKNDNASLLVQELRAVTFNPIIGLIGSRLDIPRF